MKEKSKIIILFSILAIILLVGCASLAPIDLISANVRDGTDDGHYAIFVDTILHNKGGATTKTIWASIQINGGYWKKSQLVSFAEGETKSLTFTFTEPEQNILAQVEYKIWTE